MTSIGELSLDLDLDTGVLDERVRTLGNRYRDVTIPARVGLDTSGVDAEWRKQRNRFKNSSFTTSVQLRVNSRELQQQIKGISVSVTPKGQEKEFESFANKVGDQLQKAIQKSFPTKNVFEKLAGGVLGTFTGIAGSIFSAILFPIKAASTGLAVIFGGVGLQIGTELSQGISKGLTKALENAVGQSIGSTEALGQKVGQSISQGIGIVLEETVGKKITSTVGKTAKNFVGEGAVVRESKSRQAADQAQAEQKRQEAIKILAKEFKIAERDQPRGVALKKQLDEKVPIFREQKALFDKAFNTEKARLEERSKAINIKLSKEQVAERINKTYKQANIKQTVSPEDITKKEVDFYSQFVTSQQQLLYVQLGLKSKLGDAKAKLQLQEQNLKKISAEAKEILGRIGTAFRGLEITGGLKPGQGLAKPKIPSLYKDFVSEVVKASGVAMPDAANIPKLKAGKATSLGGIAEYDAAINTIQVRPEVYKSLIEGKVSEIIGEGLDAIVHELRHAVQYNFGESKKINIDLLRPDQEELKTISTKIEGSVGVQTPKLQPLARKLEADAYTFSERNRNSIGEKIAKKRLSADFEQQFGIGGSKTAIRTQSLFTKLTATSQLASSYNIDAQAAISSIVKEISTLTNNLKPLREKARNLDVLSAKEVIELQKGFLTAIQQEGQVINNFAQLQQKIVQEAQSIQALGENPGLLEKEILKARITTEANIKRSQQQEQQNLQENNEKARKQLKLNPTIQNSEIKPSNTLNQAQINQTRIGALVKQGFKGSGKTLKIINEEIASRAVDAIEQQISFLDKELSRSDLSGEIKQKLGGLRGATQNRRRAYALSLTKARSEALNQQVIRQSNPQSVSQSRGNSLDRLAAVGDFNPIQAVKQEFERLQQSVKRSTSLRTLEQRAKEAEKESAKAEAARKKAEARNQQFIENSEAIAVQRIKAARILQQMEREITPDITANVAIQDVSKQRERVKAELKRLKAAPRAYLQERGENAVLSRARYLTENAPAIANLTASKVGPDLSPRQVNQLVKLQSSFTQFGESASNYQQAPDKKRFKELRESVVQLEKDLKVLGVPLLNINREIDKYVDKLIRLQKEGKIGIGVDIESLAPEKFNQVNDQLGRFGDALANSSTPGGKFVETLGAIFKGFIAFQGLNFLKGFLQNLATGAFKVYVELDALRTSLNYTYGGAIQGGRALSFVRKQVEDLRIPLKPAIEGFAQLSASTKGSALEGRGTRELFKGVAQASTVLSLSADKTSGVMLALSQSASKGKVYMEELLQIAERVPGTFDLIAQALGVSGEQLNKMLQSGRVLSQDALPRLGAQLQAQFGEAAKTAANNAQSAIFAFENAFLSLQAKIGEGVAPIVVPGINTLTSVLQVAANNGETLTQVLSAAAVVISIQLIPSVFTLIKSLPFIQAGIAKITGGIAGAAAAAKMFALQFAIVFGAIEIFNALNRQINGGEFAQSFKKFEDTALSAAAGVRKLKDEVEGLNQKEPPASNWMDSVLMFTRQLPLLNKIPKQINIGDFEISPFRTYAEQDRDRAIESIYKAGSGIRDAASDVREQVVKAGRGKGELPLLKGVDDQLQQLSQRRSILQAKLDRTYTQKGKPIPLEAKLQVTELSKEFQKLSEQRADIAKPFVDQLNRIKKAGEAAKAQLEILNTPEGAAKASVSGLADIGQLRAELEAQVKISQQAQAKLEKLLLTAKADPIVSLTDAFRKLNTELGKNAEKAQYAAAARQEAIAKKELSGFSKDPFASQNASLGNAKAELQRQLTEIENLQKSINERRAAISSSSAQPILEELGVNASTSAAELQALIDKETDEAKKKILENLKQVKEDELKVAQSRTQIAQQQLEIKRQIEAKTTAVIQKGVADRDAIIKRQESAEIVSIRKRQLNREITEKEAGELIAKEQLKTLSRQEDAIKAQLRAYQKAYKSGQISAATYLEKERELVTQLADFKKQKIEQELAIREAINQKILENVELANRKAEAIINTSSNRRILTIKQEAIAQGQLNPKDAGQRERNLTQELDESQTQTTLAEINETKRKLAEVEKLKIDGVKTDRDATLEKLQLEQQLGQQRIQLADQQLGQIKRLEEQETRRRENLIKGIDAQIQSTERLNERTAARLEFQNKGIELQSKGIELQEKELDLLQRTGDLSKQISDSRQNLAKALSDASVSKAQAKVDRFGRGQELFGRILSEDKVTDMKVADGDIAYLRKVMASQLKEVGIDVNFGQIGYLKEEAKKGNVGAQRSLNQMEISVLDARAKLEEKLTQKRLEGLKQEQTYQQASLAMDLRRAEIQAQSGVFAAQQAEFQAEQARIQVQQSQLQLENAIKIAQLEEKKANLLEDQRERAIAVEQARTKQDISRNSLQQIPKQLEQVEAQRKQAGGMKSFAETTLLAQKELAANAQAAQAATQQNELSQFAASESARKQALALQQAEIAAKRTSESSEKTANAAERTAAATNGGVSFNNLSGKQLEQLGQAEKAFDRSKNRPGDLLMSAMSMRDNPFFKLLLNQSGNQELSSLADSLKNRPMEVGSTVMKAQLGNKDVVEELKRLNERVEKLGRPNVSVSTATPLEDTLKIVGNMR